MNPTNTSSFVTGGAAITGAMLGQLVVYFCTLVRVTPPPPDVAGIIGALIFGGGHALVNWINVRWPAPVAAPAETPAHPAPAAP